MKRLFAIGLMNSIIDLIKNVLLSVMAVFAFTGGIIYGVIYGKMKARKARSACGLTPTNTLQASPSHNHTHIPSGGSAIWSEDLEREWAEIVNYWESIEQSSDSDKPQM